METTVYILEDYRKDCEHSVIGVYNSFEEAKTKLIDILKESIMSYENELNEYEKNEGYTEELHSLIIRLKRLIKNVEKAPPTPYYTCGQLYIAEHTLMAIQNFFFAIRKMTVILNKEG